VAGWWQKLRISLIFVIFEGGMPLIGLGLGSALARGIGHVASYLAAAAVKLSRIGIRNTRHLDPGYLYGDCRALEPNDVDGPS
jgi:hypothetical protein